MLDEAQTNGDEGNIGNVENNNPRSPLSGGDGLNMGSKARQSLLKKGGKKLRSPHHHKAARGGPGIRLADHNNNNNNTLAVPTGNRQHGSELTAGTQSILTLHHLNQGLKKEVNFRNCFQRLKNSSVVARIVSYILKLCIPFFSFFFAFGRTSDKCAVV